MTDIHFETFDHHPPHETQRIDQGLGDFNEQAAPLHEVRPLACVARLSSGEVIGGAVGRRWGTCAELQQLWVSEAHQKQGLGSELVRLFEKHAQSHGCSSFFLETFSFQAAPFYQALGYTCAFSLDVYPHGIVKHLLIKRLNPTEKPPPAPDTSSAPRDC